MITSLEDWATMLNRQTPASAVSDTTLNDLAPARYRLKVANLGETCSQAAEVNVGPDEHGKEFSIDSACAGGRYQIKGMVTEPREGVIVVLLPVDSATGVEAAIPDQEGKFTFSSLPPGRYKIAAQRGSRWFGDAKAGMDLELRGGAISHVVIAPPPDPKQEE